MTERQEALARVIEYAKGQGFTKAHAAYWDPDNADTPLESLAQATDGEVGVCEVMLGVFLDASIWAECHYDEAEDEYPQTIFDDKSEAEKAHAEGTGDELD